ncbi:hypothetical protein BH18ACT2_BH18ACT2_23330 [soil metagenome]
MPTIPPRPDHYDPEGLPPGDQFEAKYPSFWRDRPMLPTKPRLLIVHTNAANNESDLDSQQDWAEAKPNENTCPTWQVERSGRARRMLPSDRRSIANATRDDIQVRDGYPDVATFSTSIETCDAGWGPGKPGEDNVFTEAQGESVARIIAYESWGNGYPIVTPDRWYGSGIAAHTDPFPYPYYTIKRGKTCPGRGKKEQLLDWLMPRAREIVAAWNGAGSPPQEATWDPSSYNFWLFPLDPGKPTLRYGDEDPMPIGHILYSEHALNIAAFLHAEGAMSAGEPNGTFGEQTRRAVVALQANQGLAVTGVIEATTWRNLDAHITAARALS